MRIVGGSSQLNTDCFPCSQFSVANATSRTMCALISISEKRPLYVQLGDLLVFCCVRLHLAWYGLWWMQQNNDRSPNCTVLFSSLDIDEWKCRALGSGFGYASDIVRCFRAPGSFHQIVKKVASAMAVTEGRVASSSAERGTQICKSISMK